jgi:hypothetical protein
MNCIRRLTFLAIFISATMFAESKPSPFINVPLVPESATPGGAAFTLTVNGTSFVSGATVEWNGSPRATQFISSSQLQTSISAADIAKANTVAITVRNPGSHGGSSNFVYFPIRVSSTTVTFAPNGGVAHTGPLAAGDFNGDGNLDIAMLLDGHNRQFINLYPGNGDGTFGTRIQSPAKFNNSLCCSVVSLLAADFNGDGKLDLAVNEFDGDGNDPPDGYLMLGNGDGSFRKVPGANYTFAAMAAGDFNGDGLADIVASGYADEALDTFTSIYLTDESSNLTLSQSFEDIGGYGAALGDFNGDGKLDLALVGPVWFGQTNGVWVALGNGDGTFQTPVEYATTYPASNVFAADLNGDGKLDLVTDGICTLYGNGDGTFTAGPCLNTGFEYPLQTMALADFNGDGKLDVMLWTSNPITVNVYLGNGNGTFNNPMSYVPPEPQYPYSLAVGDFNNDGKFDFALNLKPGTGVFLQPAAKAGLNSGGEHK